MREPGNLDDFFNNPEFSELFDGVEVKKTKIVRSSNPLEKKFIEIHDFFGEFGRLPSECDDNTESNLFRSLVGIARKPESVAKIRHLDSLGVIDMYKLSLEQNPVGVEEKSTPDVLPEQIERDSPFPALEQLLIDHSELIGLLNVIDLKDDKPKLPNFVLVRELIHSMLSSVNELAHSFRHSLPEPEPEPEPEDDSMDDILSDMGDEISMSEILEDPDLGELFEGVSESQIQVLGGERASIDDTEVDQTSRTKCDSFDSFKDKFLQYEQDLNDGRLVISPSRYENISEGDIFLWDNLIAIITGEKLEGDYKEHSGYRLHVVFSNGTEAWLREGSIKRSMYAYSDRGNKILAKRLVYVEKDLLTNQESNGINDVKNESLSGYIYVLRTLSKDPALHQIKNHAVKIGVTKNPVAVRISNAEKDPTFLCSPVEVLSTFELHNLDCQKVETMLHAFFSDARLEIKAMDRLGNPVNANEWFLVSDKSVSEAVRLLLSGDLHEYRYNKQKDIISRAATSKLMG